MRVLVIDVNMKSEGAAGRKSQLTRAGRYVASLATRGAIATAVLLVGAAAVEAQVLTPCTTNCAQVTVGEATGGPGGSVTIPVSFAQGPDDGQPDEGNDNVAAIAFTIGIPGEGSGVPLTFAAADCADANADGLPDAVTVSSAIRDNFRVVVENTECSEGTCGCAANRTRCLCPGDGQTADNFVNVVVFGPKDLPATGPVTINPLPSGELFRLKLQIAQGFTDVVIPLRIFSQIDDPEQVTKPQFAANLSIGDQAAIDQTAAANASRVAFDPGSVTVTGPLTVCTGDCDDDDAVEINELITGVNIALGTMPRSACEIFDKSQDGTVAIDELVAGVNNSLNGCPGP